MHKSEKAIYVMFSCTVTPGKGKSMKTVKRSVAARLGERGR